MDRLIPTDAVRGSDDIWRWARFSYEEPIPLYRYMLGRVWDPSAPRVLFAQMNPSTADGTSDDATLRRNIGFAKAWRYGGCIIVNAYAWRETSSKLLLRHLRGGKDVVGLDNDRWITRMSDPRLTDLTIACWGINVDPVRAAKMVSLLTERRDIHAIRVTKSGHPEHPLYLPGNLTPVLFRSKPIEVPVERTTPPESK